MTTTIDLLYPDIELPGINSERELLKKIRCVAYELFEKNRNTGMIRHELKSGAEWYEACRSMLRFPQFIPDAVVIGLRVEDEEGGEHLSLCNLLAEELLHQQKDGAKTLRLESAFEGEILLATKSQKITLNGGRLEKEERRCSYNPAVETPK